MTDVRAAIAAERAALSIKDLLTSLRDNVNHPWKPPGGGYEGALSHDVIHGLDITVPLGIGTPKPAPAQELLLFVCGREI